MKYYFQNKSFKNSIEEYIIRKLNKKAPKIYTYITDDELETINDKIKKKFNIIIDKNIIASIRSSYVKNHIMHNNYKINKISLNNYENKNILLLCEQYDISPLNIIRYVFDHKYKKNLNKIMNNMNILNDYDKKQLEIALQYDKYTNPDNTFSQEKSKKFEYNIEKILKQYKVKYKTQEDLTKEQIKEVGHPYNTPDFLILSDLIINDRTIKWIDAKNFYGSNIKFDVKNIKKQIKKYIEKYGPGCIVYSLGYNEKIQNSIDNVLFIGYESLK